MLQAIFFFKNETVQFLFLSLRVKTHQIYYDMFLCNSGHTYMYAQILYKVLLTTQFYKTR